MGKKEEYKEKNLQYLQVLSTQADVCSLPCGIFYKVLQTGTGTVSPNVRSIVTVHYKGSLITGKEFDNSYSRNCPEAFRLCDVIDGWQLALQQMHTGDKWIIFQVEELPLDVLQAWQPFYPAHPSDSDMTVS